MVATFSFLVEELWLSWVLLARVFVRNSLLIARPNLVWILTESLIVQLNILRWRIRLWSLVDIKISILMRPRIRVISDSLVLSIWLLRGLMLRILIICSLRLHTRAWVDHQSLLRGGLDVTSHQLVLSISVLSWKTFILLELLQLLVEVLSY